MAHYRRVLIALKERNMLKPFVTIWHFTLPLWFLSRGVLKEKMLLKFLLNIPPSLYELGNLCEHFSTMNNQMFLVVTGGCVVRGLHFKRFKLPDTVSLQFRSFI